MTMTLGIFIQSYWSLITFAIGIAITWWRFSLKFATKQVQDTDKMKELSDKMVKLEAKVDAVFPDIATIKTDVAVMKNTLEFIKGSIMSSSSGTIQIQK